MTASPVTWTPSMTRSRASFSGRCRRESKRGSTRRSTVASRLSRRAAGRQGAIGPSERTVSSTAGRSRAGSE
ncbi:hypothetical protein [Micromonospora sp. b486]|uniref:hypothetical protein n=1 Tax=Micromonospora sp. b486 TaxID=3053986 RepID=UPI00259CB245|nr:hypothetical protein [Micromonospora sp. b486]MDM4784565.1 hypothetical protein [Micromonospora sp. b486]